MAVLQVVLLLAASYLLLAGLAWLFQERLAFPAPRAQHPDPSDVGLPGGEVLRLTMADGTRLSGWWLPPSAPAGPPPWPALVWCYGNGENIATIWPAIRDFRPPHAAIVVVDYPGYGASEGRTTEAGIYEAATIALGVLRARPEADPARVYVYGRSLGSAVAARLAAQERVAGLVLESPFTCALEMSRRHYALFPACLLHLSLDNLAAVAATTCPVLVLHGTADRLVPISMGRRVAAAARGPVRFVEIAGAGHNETYGKGGAAYRAALAEFVR